jgi:putative glycosyltransferase (TIGR04348 family)
MTILLITPGSSVRHSGNRCTASQWADILTNQGHEVIVCYDIPETLPSLHADLLIAMHGVKCHGVIALYRATVPDGNVLLALTGTDIYPEPSETARESMERADGLIILQEKAIEKVPPELRSRTTVVIQSVRRTSEHQRAQSEFFEVCIVGHLRDVKNPLLTAAAARRLPVESRIRIRHAGGILEPKYESLVAEEQRNNPRYRWLGELSSEAVSALITSCDLMVLTSRSEGGARVIGESIVQGTPVLSTKIDGVVGLLGEEYPGFVPDDDPAALAAMLSTCETNPEFFQRLQEASAALACRFSPEAEAHALGEAIAGVSGKRHPET